MADLSVATAMPALRDFRSATLRGQERATQPHRGRETRMPGTTETGSPGRESAAQIHRTMQMQQRLSYTADVEFSD